MTARRTTALHNLNRQRAGHTSQHLSDCKICREGIYRGQAHRWHRSPIGLCHDDCIRRQDDRAELLAAVVAERFGTPAAEELPDPPEWQAERRDALVRAMQPRRHHDDLEVSA